MTSYESHEHYVQDQIRSYKKAKKYLKELKEKIYPDLLPDYRGTQIKLL